MASANGRCDRPENSCNFRFGVSSIVYGTDPYPSSPSLLAKNGPVTVPGATRVPGAR